MEIPDALAWCRAYHLWWLALLGLRPARRQEPPVVAVPAPRPAAPLLEDASDWDGECQVIVGRFRSEGKL